MISRKILLLCTCMSHGAIVREFKKKHGCKTLLRISRPVTLTKWLDGVNVTRLSICRFSPIFLKSIVFKLPTSLIKT